VAFLEILNRRKAEVLAGNADTWQLRLEPLQGKIGGDGVERVSTQELFDVLEVPQRKRTAGACRRLAGLMRELGLNSVKARGLTRGGFRDQVRGYARDARDQARSGSDYLTR
jgi:hypothetical protein